MQGKRGAASAALAVLLVLGAAGCGATDEAPEVPVPPRPAGTGPLTKDVVRADVDGSVAVAGLPRNAEDYGRHSDEGVDAPEGSGFGGSLPGRCLLGLKSFHEESAPVDLSRYDKLLDALREREWQPVGERRNRAYEEVVNLSEQSFRQRGWLLRTDFRLQGERGGVITLNAYDEACVGKSGIRREAP
ncbi:hypothetical protein [Streptomyces filamentosus]|uniref:hypothetical protein n=1 Tax=Streptomyces filamentosus TaxID=67294 RepID=UPI00123A6FDE|nr:hypothetical protein [Streptomyces filamentosus]KAA6217396.1 hypothetical protein CP979_10885 [Streptomyces filamentosus]